MQLQDREAELKLQENFYKEQLARIEKKVRQGSLYFWGRGRTRLCGDPKDREPRCVLLQPGTVS